MPQLRGHTVRAALALLLWAVAVTPAVADGPSVTSGWTARPSAGGSGASDEGRPRIYLEGAPGTVLEDRISVANPAGTPLTVRLRGAGAYKSSAKTGTWLRLAATTVTVPARTRADVPFAVTVPSATPPGGHAGAIVAESGGREVPVRVHLRVSGPTLAALTVEDVSVSGRTIHYTLVNRGNTALVPRLTVGADGVFATLLRRPERTLPMELEPGGRAELTEPWPDAPALDSVTVRLRVAAAGGVHDEASASAVYVPRGPLAGGALLIVLAAFAAGAYRLRSRRRGPPERQEPSRQQADSDRHLVMTGADT